MSLRRQAAATRLPLNPLLLPLCRHGPSVDKQRAWPQWLDQHVVSAMPSSYAMAGAELAAYARPQSVPPPGATMLAGRLATWPDTTTTGQQHGDGDSLTAALAALQQQQGRPSPFEGFAAASHLTPPPALPGWDAARSFGSAAAAVDDPIKQVQMLTAVVARLVTPAAGPASLSTQRRCSRVSGSNTLSGTDAVPGPRVVLGGARAAAAAAAPPAAVRVAVVPGAGHVLGSRVGGGAAAAADAAVPERQPGQRGRPVPAAREPFCNALAMLGTWHCPAPAPAVGAWLICACSDQSCKLERTRVQHCLHHRLSCCMIAAPAACRRRGPNPCPVPCRCSCSDSGSASHAPRSTSTYPRDSWSCRCAAGQRTDLVGGIQQASCRVCFLGPHLALTYFILSVDNPALQAPRQMCASKGGPGLGLCLPRLVIGCVCNADRNSRRSLCSSSWRGQPWKARSTSTRSGCRSSASVGSSGVACARCAALCAPEACSWPALR